MSTGGAVVKVSQRSVEICAGVNLHIFPATCGLAVRIGGTDGRCLMAFAHPHSVDGWPKVTLYMENMAPSQDTMKLDWFMVTGSVVRLDVVANDIQLYVSVDGSTGYINFGCRGDHIAVSLASDEIVKIDTTDEASME